jgi:hypothetical protein
MVSGVMGDMNPRVLRDHLLPFVGKKVTIGTSDFHYISGIFESIAGNDVLMKVNGKPVTVHANAVATIREAPALQAEYVK